MMQLAKRNLRSATVHFFLALCLVPGRLSAQSTQTASESPFSDRTEGDFIIKDFHFNDGEVLPELRLHYVTLGTPHRNSSGQIDNAVLLLHSTGGDTTEFFDSDFSGLLYGAGEPLDLAKFYLIIPDSIGHGKSSKPSDGLRARFPHYGYEDMVTVQHQLVTEKLSVTHLRLILGLSMGGMHTWLWGERYPEMMDALFPISALPVETGGRNRLWRHMIVEMIRNDPEWKNGDYQQQPHCLIRLAPLVLIMPEIQRGNMRTIPRERRPTNGMPARLSLRENMPTLTTPFTTTMLPAITTQLPTWKK